MPRLKVKWAFGYSGNLSYGQPTIAGGRVFVTTAAGQVYSLDAATGCTYWSYSAGSGVRTAVTIGPMPDGAGARYAAYIGDEQTWVHAPRRRVRQAPLESPPRRSFPGPRRGCAHPQRRPSLRPGVVLGRGRRPESEVRVL